MRTMTGLVRGGVGASGIQARGGGSSEDGESGSRRLYKSVCDGLGRERDGAETAVWREKEKMRNGLECGNFWQFLGEFGEKSWVRWDLGSGYSFYLDMDLFIY